MLPLFAFANAGVSLAGMTLAKVVSAIPMGIALGLFIGKPIGIFAFSLAAIGLRLAGKPEGATWPQLFGVAILGGIGFTMSLFIGMLAFADAERAAEIRIGVLLGSLASALRRLPRPAAPSPGRPTAAFDGRRSALKSRMTSR